MTKITIFDPNVGDRPANLALVNNFTATADPTTANDSSQGYSSGSVWINPADGRSFLCISAGVGAAVWQLDAQGEGLAQQGTPTAKTVSATLTAVEIQAGIITVNQGGAGASALQLPTAAAMDTAFPQAVANSSFDFSVINISTVAAEDASITTNSGWTLVGNMDVASNAAATDKSVGRFRARKTATGAWTLYRIG